MSKIKATNVRGSSDYDGSITFEVNGVTLSTGSTKTILLKQGVICIIDGSRVLTELGIEGHAKFKDADGNLTEGGQSFVRSPVLAKALLKVYDMINDWKDPDGVLLAEEAEIE